MVIGPGAAWNWRVARFGYVVLSIDGPRAGEATGGPEDTEKTWISVEQVVNMPARLQLSVSCLATTSAFSRLRAATLAALAVQ
jgi:hypothetical protein